MSPLLIVSFEYGPYAGAEGICTSRLVDALRTVIPVHVLTARRSVPATDPDVDALSSFAHRPSRVQMTLGHALVGAPVPDWDWVIRAGRRRVAVRAIYGRANPLASLIAAGRLAERTGLPLLLHFSDPIPSPWDDQACRRTQWTRSAVARLLQRASLLTFTTPEAITYTRQMYGAIVSDRSIVLRNIAPSWPVASAPGPSGPSREIAYIGSFTGHRRPHTLLSGIAAFNRGITHRPVSILFVGTALRHTQFAAQRCGDIVPVHREPHTPDVLPYYRRARFTAIVDADDPTPVFLASKTVEAIHAAWRVLIVSPPASPARTLFENHFRSVQFVSHDPSQIASAIERLDALHDSDVERELPSRQTALEQFRGPAVVSALLAELRRRAL